MDDRTYGKIRPVMGALGQATLNVIPQPTADFKRRRSDSQDKGTETFKRARSLAWSSEHVHKANDGQIARELVRTNVDSFGGSASQETLADEDRSTVRQSSNVLDYRGRSSSPYGISILSRDLDAAASEKRQQIQRHAENLKLRLQLALYKVNVHKTDASFAELPLPPPKITTPPGRSSHLNDTRRRQTQDGRESPPSEDRTPRPLVPCRSSSDEHTPLRTKGVTHGVTLDLPSVFSPATILSIEHREISSNVSRMVSAERLVGLGLSGA